MQLTDALRLLCGRERVYGVVLAARRHDIGKPVGWLAAKLAFAAADPSVWGQIAPPSRELLSADGPRHSSRFGT